MKNVYIVTGANGFLGNNIVRQLPKTSEIRALILPNSNRLSLEGLSCNIYEGDVTKPETLEEIFKVEKNTNIYVIHCAAIVSVKLKKDPNIYNVNVNGTKNIVQKVLETNAKLIYINSVHAIPEKSKQEQMKEISDFDPDKVKGQYAKTKAIAARYVLKMTKEKNLNACILHLSWIIGPKVFGNTHLTQLIIVFARGKLIDCVLG